MYSYLFVTAISFLLLKANAESKLIPNGCTDLDDGEQFVKLLEGDDYAIVKVKCSNGYTMLDYSLDSDISTYFTSWLKWHYSIAGPSQSDHVNWEEWYVPDDGNSKYLVSENCDVCDESVQQYSTKNGYYMNANLFGCFVYPRGMPDCDFDIDTYECHACYSEVGFGTIYQTEFGADDATDMGACMTYVRESSADVDRTFDECTYQTETGYKPTIGTDGHFCVCVQSSSTQYLTVDSSEITEKTNTLEKNIEIAEAAEVEEEKKQSLGWDYQTKYLYKEDFAKGTYRIQEPGTYILMEDIEFDWNAGDIEDDPNAEGSWWPNTDDEEYPGWGETREQYFMGFFAGITIECNNVIIDLNGHTLQQSQAFFYQQGFFSDIEVQSQPFIPGQGVGFFGSDPMFPENVVIKNGFLGRSSHHCIHGNYNKNLLIEDIVCSEFSTHGIQLNGFDSITIRNVEVGPSNNEQYLSSEYTHYRFILERMRLIVEDENPTNTIQFVNREPVTVDELRTKLQKEMNYAFKYVMLGEEGDAEDEIWLEAKKLFLNPTGFGYGASIYGIFLSYPGANVLSYHINSKISSSATLENVYIHDISHKTKEYVGLRTDLRMFVNSFNAPMHVQYLIGDDNWNTAIQAGGQRNFQDSYQYEGNILTDSTIAIHQLSQNWGRLQIMYLLTDELVAWAKGQDVKTALGDTKEHEIQYLCSVDGMIHSVKGTFGLRIDGVEDVSINSMIVENIVEYSPLGYELCGECEKCAFEGRTPYQIGYAGNMAQAISADYATNMKIKDLTIRHVESKSGRAYGLAVWPGTSVTMQGEILVENIQAGGEVPHGLYTYDSLPNVSPEACGIRVYNSDAYDETHNDHQLATVTVDDDASITTQCVSGHETCWALTNTYTQVGDYSPCNQESSTSTSISKSKSQKLINISKRIHTKYTRNEHKFSVAMASVVAIVFAVMWCAIKICTQNNKKSLLVADSEKIPLMHYGSFGNN